MITAFYITNMVLFIVGAFILALGVNTHKIVSTNPKHDKYYLAFGLHAVLTLIATFSYILYWAWS